MREQLDLLPAYLGAHLQLSLTAILVGAAVSVPLGIWVTRHRRYEQSVLGVASVIQTIPSLALLAIMVPALAALGAFTASALGVEISSIGFVPALIALTLYSLLPILRNTVTGILGVDDALNEAARGVGMTERQRLLRVELPQALPVMVAGLRTSTVWVVGMATLSTPVGAPSLGNFIFTGLQTRNLNAVLVGCVAAAGLAILLDNLIHGIEIGIARGRRGLLLFTTGVLVLLYGYTAVSFVTEVIDDDTTRVRVGSKAFTEQYILSHLIARTIEERTGIATESVGSLGSTVAFDALANDALDVYVDYSGTIWATIMKRDDLPDRRSEVLERVSVFLQREHGILVVGALGFENTYAMAMRRTHAANLGITKLSELGVHSADLTFATDYEFLGRIEWKSIEAKYQLSFARSVSMDPALMYGAVANQDADVLSAFSTDGRIEAFDLVVIEDDRGAIPPYDAIVLAGPRLQRDHPEVIAALKTLLGTIDGDTMRRLNFEVDKQGRTPRDVADSIFKRSSKE